MINAGVDSQAQQPAMDEEASLRAGAPAPAQQQREPSPTHNAKASLDALAALDALYEEGELEFEDADSFDSSLDSDLEGLEELAELAELEEAEDGAEDGAKEGAADDAEALPREKLLLAVHDSFEYDGTAAPDGRALVRVSPAFSDEAYDFLVMHGPILFHAKFRMQEARPAAELLAALGFALPVDVAADPQFSEQDFDFALQIAMRLAMVRRKRLPQPRTLDEVAAAIERAQRILVVTGAGISTSLGIPDFRSDNGLYAQLRHLGLGDPQEVFDIRLFREDPSIFYSVARKILPDPALYTGTPTHQFIKLLADRGKLLRNYTQNIDNIEHHVGLAPEKVVQCHGSFGSAHCVTCGFAVPNGEDLFPAIRAGEVPRCPQCAERRAKGKRRANSDDDDDDDDDDASYGALKPDITFFGESLPPRFDRLLLDEGDARNCDLVICMGTSLKVAPVSEIVKVVRRRVPQIFVSKTPASHVVFEAMFLGSCDDTVELLAQKLGWPLEHAMNKRPPGQPETEFPQGTIRFEDGVYAFEDPVEMEAERAKKEERRSLKLQAKAEREARRAAAALSASAEHGSAPAEKTETPASDSEPRASETVLPEDPRPALPGGPTSQPPASMAEGSAEAQGAAETSELSERGEPKPSGTEHIRNTAEA